MEFSVRRLVLIGLFAIVFSASAAAQDVQVMDSAPKAEAVIGERPVIMVLLNSFGKLTRTADARRVRKWMEAQGAAPLGGAAELAKK